MIRHLECSDKHSTINTLHDCVPGTRLISAIDLTSHICWPGIKARNLYSWYYQRQQPLELYMLPVWTNDRKSERRSMQFVKRDIYQQTLVDLNNWLKSKTEEHERIRNIIITETESYNSPKINASHRNLFK